MKFKTPDGQVFTGRSYTDVVKAMGDEKMENPASREGYRSSVAKRARVMFEVDVDTSSDETFVRSLVEHKLLERKE